jgi:hypothetical protein
VSATPKPGTPVAVIMRGTVVDPSHLDEYASVVQVQPGVHVLLNAEDGQLVYADEARMAVR